MKKIINSLFLFMLLILSSCNHPIILKNVITEKKGIFDFFNYGKRIYFVDEIINPELKQIWTNETYGSFSNSSSLIFDNYLIVADLSGRVFVFNRFDGKLIGYEKFQGEIPVTPVINNFRLFIPVNRSEKNFFTIYTFDLLNGKILNENNFNGKIQTEIMTIDDGIVLISNQGEITKMKFYGEIEWKVKNNFSITSDVILSNNKYLLGNNKNELIVFNVFDNKIEKKIKVDTLITSGITVENENCFFSDEAGKFYSLNFYNGKINWSVKTRSKLKSFPVQDKNYIYFGNLSGDIYCVDKKNGNVKWIINTNGLINSTPLLFKNVLIVPDFNGKLHIINIDDGNILNTIIFERRVKLSPIYYDGIIYIGTDRGIINAYKVFNN